LEEIRLGGNPETSTSTLPPMELINDGFTERTEVNESSTAEKNDEMQETAKPFVDVTDRLTAKEFTEDGELTTIVACVVDTFDGSKYELKTFADMSSRGAGRMNDILGESPTGKFLTINVI
jgi:hypothetical protein